jgi:hypothetical protein
MDKDERGRPNFLRQQQSFLGGIAGLSTLFMITSILTPVILLNSLKNLFGETSNASPSAPNEPEKITPKTIVSEWELKNVIRPMIEIGHVNVEWKNGEIPKTFSFNSYDLNILHARAETVAISPHQQTEINIAQNFMRYFTRDGYRKMEENIFAINLSEQKLS